MAPHQINLLLVVAPSLTPDSYTEPQRSSATRRVVAPSLTPDSYTLQRQLVADRLGCSSLSHPG